MYKFNIYKITMNTFTIKAKCSVSMEKIKRDVVVTLTRKTSGVEKARCSCPVGASSNCNHIVALLFEIAVYSLKRLTEVPQVKLVNLENGEFWAKRIHLKNQ